MIETVLNGITGEVEVNGHHYDEVMPAFAVSLNNQEISNILNYVLIGLNNYTDSLAVADVSNRRKTFNWNHKLQSIKLRLLQPHQISSETK